jgi:UDP-glucose:(heptosyl)LPS alpha-1,3-glucosyltransferase
MAGRVRRIAVVIPKYGLVGGAEGFAAEMTERLAVDPRFEFHVFANRWIAHSDRITFHKVPIVAFPKFLTIPSFAFFADRQIRAAGIDLIHAHDRIFTADLVTLHGVPHRFWVREVRRKRPSLFDRATARVEDALVHDPRCRLFLPVSGLTRDIFLREHPVTPDRVRVIHPGIDPRRYAEMDRPSCRAEIAAQFGFAPGEKIILFVSMNFELKGLDVLMKALAVLANSPSAPAFRLLVVGKGTIRKYRALATSLGIGERVAFAGVIPTERLKTFYLGADLYAMPSRFDTFGMVVLEAMAASLPVLVSNRVGAGDLVREGVNGYVVPVTAGPEEIAGKLGLMLPEDTRERMGRAAREAALSHTWDEAAASVAMIYEELLRRRSEGERT